MQARIADDLDPAAQFVLRAIRARAPQHTWHVETDANLGKDTIRSWYYRRHIHGPSIKVVRAALRALGYDLAVVPFDKV